ncbi:MAG TPA: ABC transporter substrate-binding protein [Burkholderiales bacterium]|nr:ABC transporter substrate-binding protein [Burkholderiales bacterium]
MCAAVTVLHLSGTSAAELKIGLSAAVTTLDPHFVAAQPNLTVARHVFESLTDVDEKTRLIPGLAVSWRALDATTWEFKLRRGVKFHDGSDFTAEDVLFSLDRPYAIKGSPGGFTSYVRAIAAKKIVDSHTIRITTSTPYGALPQDINSILIVSSKAAARAGTEDFDSGRAMVGTGPYRFVRYARGERVELARYDGYWGPKPAWDRVLLRMLPSDPVRSAALLSGELDAIEHVPSADLVRLRSKPGLQLVQTISWRTIFLHLDQYRSQPPSLKTKSGTALARNPFMDVRVRRAISKAINRPAIVERVMEKLAVPAANVVSPGVFGHNPELKAEPFDPEGAKRLLAEAGYPDGFSVTLGAPNDRYINDEQVAQAVAQMLTRIGIVTKVEAMPFSAFLARVRKEEFAFAMIGWGSFAGDLALRSLIAGPSPDKGYGAWNWARYASPKLDRLIEQSLSAVDAVKRQALAQEAAAAASNDVALVPLYHQLATWAMKKHLTYAARTDEFTFAHHFRPR